ncbi:Cysteine-rich RLK (receptor-like protein kinase) 8 [Cucumis melo var. makuwa]|nr:Cysteine-rich RLK (receptor-like protein kinase) 8 [Cucumis melo var. makuwa]
MYFTKFKTLIDELNSYRPACTCGSCRCGGNLEAANFLQTEYLMDFLMGLNDSYAQTRTQLLLMEPIPSISRAFSLLLQEEQQRAISSFSPAINTPAFDLVDKYTSKKIGSAKLFQGLYILDQPTCFPSICAVTANKASLWHQRMGHPSTETLNSLQIPLFLKPSTVDKMSHCTICPLAKQRKLSFTSNNHLSSNAFDLIHVDIWGPFSTETYSEYSYFLTIVDDATRYTWVFMLKLKSDVISIIPHFFKLIETQYGKAIKKVRSDNAHKLKFTTFFEQKGVIHQYSCVQWPQQNSVVEKKHQHILNTARALYFQSQVPLNFWGDCIVTAVYLISRTPSRLLQWKFPFQKLNNIVPDYNSLKVFGSLCYASSLPHNHSKFQPRAIPSVFIGYPKGMKGYKLYDIEHKKIFISRDPMNDENMAENSDINETTISQQDRQPNANEETTIRRSTRITKPPSYLQAYHCSLLTTQSPPTQKSTKYPMNQYLSYQALFPTYKYSILQTSTKKEQSFYHEAVVSQEWCEAMKAELEAMETNQTWSIVPLPKGKNSIGCRWVYKIKHKADGSIERYKTRLVAKGYTQQEGLDYFETFSLVVKMVTVKTLLTIAVSKEWPLLQLDVNNAFLHGELFEEVYMDLPLGYKPQYEIQGEKLVCRLHKSIYGLKQASRQWFTKFSTFLVSLGFQQSKANYSLFIRGKNDSFIALLVYVDDIIITGANALHIQELKRALNQKFLLKDLGPLKFFLGLELARNSSGLFLSQKNYTLQLIEDTGLLGAKPTFVPMDPTTKLNASDKDILHDATPYRRLIGRLLYLTIS